MKRQISITTILLALFAATIFAPSSFAQTQPPAPQFSRVQIVRLNPGMSDEWRTFYQTEILPVLKKAGVKRQDVLTVAQGDVREYIIITPLEGLAQLDEPGALAKVLGQEAAHTLNMKHSRFFAEWRSQIQVSRPDLGFTSASKDPSKLAISVRTSVTPGRAAEYEKFVKENLLPISKKANLKAVLAGKVIAGGDPNGYRALLLFDSYAAMESYGSAMNKAAAELKLSFTPPPGVVAHTELVIVRAVPELSIRPEPQKAANK